MAEIVCPHCHTAVPHDAAFCPGCRTLLRSTGQREPALATAGESAARPGKASGSGGAPGQDVVEDAVRSSMATTGDDRWNLDVDLPQEGTQEPRPYPSDNERRSSVGTRLPRTRSSGRSTRTEDTPQVSWLARLVAWLFGLPGRVRTTSRTLGALPVTVLVVVLALLGSGGLLYAVGAFDEQGAAAPKQRAVRLLDPASQRGSCAARPSVTGAGKRVTFGATNLVDGRASTAWRCPGDGSRQRVKLSFPRPVQVTKVALVPGWATKDPTNKADRFAENGAPTAVTWRFDETTHRQRIGEPRPRWATARVHPKVRTKTVTLVIDSIRKGERRAAVAVSEIRVYGRT